MFGPAGFLVLFQLTNHVDDRLIHALHLTIGLSMVRQGSQLLHPIQLTEVCYDMAHKGLPLITDKVGRCTESLKYPILRVSVAVRAVWSCTTYATTYLEKLSCKTSTLQMMGSSLRGTFSLMEVKSTCNNSLGPLQVGAS